MSVQTQQVVTGGPLQVPQDDQIRKDLGFLRPDEVVAQRNIDPAIVKMADEWTEKLLKQDIKDPLQQEEVRSAVEGAGSEIEQTLTRKSGLLKEQIRVLASQAESSPVAKSLIDLKVNVDRINPNRYKLLSPGGVGRMFAWIPGVGITVNRYFTMWQSSGSVIDSVVMQIREGAKELIRDNETLRADQAEMRAAIIRQQKVIQTLMLVNEKLTVKIEQMEAGSEDRRFMEEEILFALRQRIGDLQTSLAVNQQGVMSYEFVIRTNRELVRGAKRCETITVRALEIAVVLAMALVKQRMVLKSIQAVDQTTAELMVANSQQLKTQGSEVFKMSANQSISMETLRQVYANLDSAFDEMARFKQEALPIMAKRMSDMSLMAAEAQKKIERMEKGNVARPKLELELEPTGALNA